MLLEVLTLRAVILVNIYYQGLTVGAVQLRTTTPTIMEHSAITLSCTDSGSQLQEVWWLLNETGSARKDAPVAQQGSSCITGSTVFLADSRIYSYSCSSTTFSVKVKNVTRSMHGDTWRCRVNNVVSNAITFSVQVPVISVAINPVNETLTVTEYSKVYISCTTSECFPKPTVTLSAGTQDISPYNYTNSNNIIIPYVFTFQLIPNRSWTGVEIWCNNENKVFSKKIHLNVTYPPDGPPVIRNHPSGGEIRVIQNSFLNLTCSVTGGLPLPKLKWDKNDSQAAAVTMETVTKSVLWFVNGTSKENVTCQYIHPAKMEETFVTVTVLYPPREPTLRTKLINGDFTEVKTSAITVIENKPITLICSAVAEPPVETFMWTGITDLMTNTSETYVQSTKRNMSGTLTCTVENIMTPSDGGSPRVGTNRKSVTVEVLYPPQVETLTNITLTEGQILNYTCAVQSGKPGTTNFTWKNPARNNIANDRMNLQIFNISRTDAGIYTCIAENLMNSTDGSVQRGTSTGKFTIDVQYAANVSEMMVNAHSEINLTLTENDIVKIVCSIEGNPAPIGRIIFSTDIYGSHESGKELVVTSPQNKTLEVEFVATCYDAGKYTCNANNTFHTGGQQTSVRTVSININCTPRMSSIDQVEPEVYTSIHVPVTLTFTTVAFPVPPLSGYTWSRQINDSYWSNVTGTSATYNVSSQGLQSNLTVKNMTKSDYGLYNVTISNSVGTFTFTFSLIPAGKPSPPVKYGIFEETVTDKSVTVWWEPEFNGGDAQRFIISYRINSSDAWFNLTTIIKETKTSSSMTRKIGNLTSGTQYHVLIYAENKFGSVRIGRDIVFQTKVTETESSRVVGAAVGGGVGGVLALAVIVAAVMFLRNRVQLKRSGTKDSPQYIEDNSLKRLCKDQSEGTHNGKYSDDKMQLVSTKNQFEDTPILPARRPAKQETALDMLEPIDFDEKGPDDAVYGNTYDMIRRIERLEIAELVPYLSDKTSEFFRRQYQKLPQGLIHPFNDSQLPENLPLNRYRGIYPYDHSRVKNLKDPTFFVNASYIDGNKKKKEYIASLGPLERTSKQYVTFWQMVWSEKSDVVVMLTKLREPTGEKCEKYWPEFGTSFTYGEITVTCTGEDVFADYILRTFTLTKEKETRKFLQFHFMAWPDKSIPENTACLLEFRRTVRSKHKTGPMIVHCSAGIGRTGTFIAIDILIEEGKHKRAVNVLQCVTKMRDQRTMMVQTVEQYHYIFKALVNALVFDNDAIAVNAFPKTMSKIKGSRFNEMYECLNKSVETDSTAESTTRTVNKTQRDKNRTDSDIPGDLHRVRLFLDRDTDPNDYINAVYVDSFIRSNHFIVAQSPLPKKVNDFLAMVVQVECSCIVSLEEMTEGQAMGTYHPSNSTTLTIGNFSISSKVLDSREAYTVSKLSITYKGQSEGKQKNVYHFQYTDWPHWQKVPSKQEHFIKFTKDVETFAKQCCMQESYMLVHCLNAFERSCLFCAVVTLTQKVDVEGEVCVPNTLRLIRSRRRKAFPNKEQFEFCFNVVNTYIGMEKNTDTADDKTYMNTALT